VFTQSIVLENLTDAFLKPNILDIKLGTALYDDGATPEKRARMEKTARETTSFETGARLTGFQVIFYYYCHPLADYCQTY
jgi:inositol-polyphosphate multikinase